MKKYVWFIWALFIAFCLVLTACSKKEVEKVYYSVDVYDTRDNYITTLSVLDGDNVDVSKIEAPEGYYFAYSDGVIENITANGSITVSKNLYQKTVKYIIDGETIYETSGKYFDIVREPSYDNSRMENDQWIEELVIEDYTYKYTYTLKYDVKTKFNLYFYDGSNQIDVGMDSYDNSVDTTLPTYTKEGYVFMGWFLSDISLYKVDTIQKGSDVDYHLYARLVKETNTFKLKDTEYHFTGVNKIANGELYVFQPVFPSGVSSNPTDYSWSTSNNTVLLVSAYSSLSIVSSGYAVLTATLTSNSAVFVNAIIKTSTDGTITVSNETEANTAEFVTVTFLGKDDEVIETQKILKGNFAYLPTPPTYDGLSFTGWDKDNYCIFEDTTFKATYSADVSNKYAGHTVSLIGDSCSTFFSYIPFGYDHFFPYPTADVYDVNMTWWMQAFNKVGAKLFVNNSYSGTCVIGGTEPTIKDSRLSKLVIDSKYADYTVIFMGNNDCAACAKYPVEYGVDKFEECYRTMLDKILKLCPTTKIVVMTLPVSSLYKTENQLKFNEVIRKLASEYNLDLVDIETVDLTDKTNGRLLVDSAHPNKKGMDLLANAVISELLK